MQTRTGHLFVRMKPSLKKRGGSRYMLGRCMHARIRICIFIERKINHTSPGSPEGRRLIPTRSIKGKEGSNLAGGRGRRLTMLRVCLQVQVEDRTLHGADLFRLRARQRRRRRRHRQRGDGTAREGVHLSSLCSLGSKPTVDRPPSWASPAPGQRRLIAGDAKIECCSGIRDDQAGKCGILGYMLT